MAVEATKEMAFHCFDALEVYLTSGEHLAAPDSVPTTRCCIFVSWHRNGRLAGCKGTTSAPRPLNELLGYFAIDRYVGRCVAFNLRICWCAHGISFWSPRSATNDSRFNPLKAKDIPLLDCSVSILHSFDRADSVYDWTVGTHGITIRFKANGRRYSAVYLPYVASEQGWTREETIESLVRKAGYRGKVDEDLLASIEVERHQASKIECTYHEWRTSKQPDTRAE